MANHQTTTTDDDRSIAEQLASLSTDAREYNRGIPGDELRFRSAVATDRERLAALYYGGAPEAPERGLTHAAIGDWLGVSRATVGRWMEEMGIRPPEPVYTRRSGEPTVGGPVGPQSEEPDPVLVAERLKRHPVERGVLQRG